MKIFIKYLVLVCSFCVLSCGVFMPRTDFEPPEDEKTNVDFYNFGSLLSGTGESFSKLDWYELFDDSFKYVNVRSASSSYGKTDLINHLNQQRMRLPGARVAWIKDETYLRELNTITLSDISYAVADSSAPDSVLFSGNCGIVIRRDANNVWRVLAWTDDPTSETAFFSPAE